MKTAAIWLKVLALCSTVALGGGYVWWSQKKAEDKRAKEEALHRTLLSSSKSKVVVEAARPDDGELPAANPRTNADFIAPDPELKKERTVLPGSKSAAFDTRSGPGAINRNSIDDILNSLDAEKGNEEPEKQRTVLPGSKSLDRILPPPDLEKKSEP